VIVETARLAGPSLHQGKKAGRRFGRLFDVRRPI
jgi:hypothetical protein